MSKCFDLAMEKIKKAYIDLYESDPHIISVFVVGSMAMEQYTERKYNDYDIRCVVDEFTPETFERVNNAIENCIKDVSTDESIGIASSDLVGPVNHHVTNKENNILIHSMVHTVDDMISFLPLTHKYMYGNGYMMVCGKDIISELKLKDARYTLKDIIEGYEGINYCIEMITNKTHRYSRYEVIEDKCVFVPYETVADLHIQYENCFYSALKNIGNLRNHDLCLGLEINSSLYEYGKRVLLSVGYTDFDFLDILLKKDEAGISKYSDFGACAVTLLENLRKYVEQRIENQAK